MTVQISSALLARLQREAANSPDYEVCGLLFGTPDRIESALPCRNVAPDPRTAFEIDPVQLLAAHRAHRGGGATIVGCYHSHPAGPPVPSARDAAAAAPDNSIWILLAAGEYACYRALSVGVIAGRFTALCCEIIDP